MAIKKLTLTDEHITLISNFKIRQFQDRDGILGIDLYDLYGGSSYIEDMAMIFGVYDKIIESTKTDIDGGKLPIELMNKFYDLDNFIRENIIDIETLIHQFSFKGGLKVGTYKCIDNIGIWEKI